MSEISRSFVRCTMVFLVLKGKGVQVYCDWKLRRVAIIWAVVTREEVLMYRQAYEAPVEAQTRCE